MDQAQTPMAEFLQTSMAKIKEMVDVNTIVGDPAAATSSSSAAASPEAAARR